MVEDTLVKEALTESMIELGAQLTQKLVDSGVDVSVAMWFFLSGANKWRLFFSSPEMSTKGSRPIYERIERVRKELPCADQLPLSSIGLLAPHNQLVNSLRLTIGPLAGISRVRYSNSAAHGQFVDDALIYRIAE
jgi:hypothetical protein